MHSLTVKLSWLAVIMLSIVAATSHAQVTCKEIVLDMPHGWWRVNVNPDGSGKIMFGALPFYGTFVSGAIDHQKLCSDIQEIATENKEKLSEPIGTVQFDPNGKSGHVWYFNNWDMASDLFDRAWDNKKKATNDIEKQHLKALAKFWEKREIPRE